VKSNKPSRNRPAETVDEHADGPAFGPARPPEDPDVNLPEPIKTEDEGWERSMLQALDAWGSRRPDSQASSKPTTQQQPGTGDRVVAREFGTRPQRRAVDRVSNVLDGVGSGVNQSPRLERTLPSDPPSSQQATTFFDRRGDALGMFETEARSRAHDAVFSESHPAALSDLSPARKANTVFAPDVFDRSEPRPLASEAKPARLQSVEPRLPASLVAPPAAETPIPSPVFPVDLSAAQPDTLERIDPLPAASPPQHKRRKTPVVDQIKRLGVAALVLLGIAEFVVIGWSLVARFATGSSGSLTITSKPAGAQVVIDGVVKGTTPATITVPEGMHAVELRSSGPTQAMAVRVDNRAQLSRYFDLAAGTAPGAVKVDTKPADAKVMIDGTFRGRSPIVVTGLNPGRHVVRIEHGLQSRETAVVLGPGVTVGVSVPIEPLPRPAAGHGWLAIWTPVELQAFENGKPVGSTRAGPWQLPGGRHDLELANAAFGLHITRTVDVITGRSVSVDAGVPSGLVSISSSSGAEIRIDGEHVGDSAIDNRPLTVGQHDVIARHPNLGERRVSVTVMPDTKLVLNLDLRR
jgi:hypothetical protein